jgi:abortive infection bacteriophage resistance protein
MFAATVTDEEKWADIYNAYLTLSQLNDYVASYLMDGLPRPLALSMHDRQELERAVDLTLDGSAAMTAIAFYGPGRWSARRAASRARRWWRVHVRRMSDEDLIAVVESKMDPRLRRSDRLGAD